MFYSGFLFGPGFLYRVLRQARSVKDPLLIMAMLLPLTGLFTITGKTNLTRQCVMTLLKFLSSESKPRPLSPPPSPHPHTNQVLRFAIRK